MDLHGFIRGATLVEDPPGSDKIEMVLRLQGVGPGQPRTIIVPFDLLLLDPTLEPESIDGHAFRAIVREERPGRWIITEIGFGDQRVLRTPEVS